MKIQKILLVLLWAHIGLFSLSSLAHEHEQLEKTKAEQLSSSAISSSEVIVNVNGMVCSFCATNIENKLKKDQAVKQVRVDLDAKKVFIALKPGQKLNEKAVKKHITKAGYKVVSIEKN